MRLFIAAELPRKLLDALAETSAVLRASVRGRFVAPDSFHVTLAFLGELPSADIALAEDALASACEGRGPIPVGLGELGSFGRARKAVLWQAVEDPTGGLAELASDLRSALDRAGLDYDAKPFRAHVTLMRSAELSGGLLPPAASAWADVDAVALFSSDLSGERPHYEPLMRYSLG